MNTIHSLGAINKHTGEYVYPKIANKKDEYSCPDCRKDLILCQGEIRVHHFRHKVDTINPCHYYNKPSESQIHKDAKMLMKMLLDKKTPIAFIRNCANCKKNEEFEIPEISETSSIQLEHRFDYNGLKIADIAYLDAGEIVCIFEICNTHKTSSENRPEPWFEIDALTLIGIANDTSINSLKIPCIRYEKCEECNSMINDFEEYYKNLSELEKFIYDKLSSFKGDKYDYHFGCDLDFDARENVTHNKKIIDLFSHDFNDKNVVIHTYKGYVEIYITSKKFYKKYNYWDFDLSVLNNPTFPYEKRIKSFNSGGYFYEASIEIIKLIINYCQFNHETDNNHDCCSICNTTYHIYHKCDKDRKNVCNHCDYESRRNTNKS
jgi:hypothetical protein